MKRELVALRPRSRKDLLREGFGVAGAKDDRKLLTRLTSGIFGGDNSGLPGLIVAFRNSSLCLPCTE